MALTVRPDDEIYQFDSKWLGPDEYTLPIQARYVAWGTWLVLFLVSALVIIPLGRHTPGGLLGSLLWAVAVSIVGTRAVMLVVDHERPLRSLPAVFGAEVRAAFAANRHEDRPVLLDAARVRVRVRPPHHLRVRVAGRVTRPVRAGRASSGARR